MSFKAIAHADMWYFLQQKASSVSWSQISGQVKPIGETKITQSAATSAPAAQVKPAITTSAPAKTVPQAAPQQKPPAKKATPTPAVAPVKAPVNEDTLWDYTAPKAQPAKPTAQQAHTPVAPVASTKESSSK